MKNIIALSLLLATGLARADVLFEGWFEVFVGTKKVGYMAQRYEFVDKKFKMAQFISTKDGETTVVETLKSVADNTLAPVSYTFSSQVGNEIKVVEGSFKGGLLTVKTTDGKQKITDSKKIKPGVFLSGFLMYVIMKNEGLAVGKSHDYFAIAEEEGAVRSGNVYVQKKEKVQGIDALVILNEFKTDSKTERERFFVFVSEKGQLLLLRAPGKLKTDPSIDVRFVAKREDAIKNFEFDRQHMKIVFGDRLPLETPAEEPKATKLTTTFPKKVEKKAEPAPETPTTTE